MGRVVLVRAGRRVGKNMVTLQDNREERATQHCDAYIRGACIYVWAFVFAMFRR